jgi:sugar phosphate isomerase/epimerase
LNNLLSCNLGSYRRYRDTAYAHLHKIGVRHVEIAAPKPSEADAVTETLGYFGLSASTLMVRGDLQNEKVVDEFLPGLQAAQKMGVKVVFTSLKAGDLPKDTATARLRAIGDAASAHGVTVALETHPDLCENATVSLRTMEAVNHPHIRLNFDTANVYYYNEGVDGVAELRKVAPYVAAVHLKDTNGGYKTWNFPTLGEGVVDYKEVFGVMNAVGMRGPFTMELEGIQGQTLDLKGQHASVEQSVAHLRRIGDIS